MCCAASYKGYLPRRLRTLKEFDMKTTSSQRHKEVTRLSRGIPEAHDGPSIGIQLTADTFAYLAGRCIGRRRRLWTHRRRP